MTIAALKCPRCGDTIYSRTVGDRRLCSCNAVSILMVDGAGAIQKTWNPDLPASPEIIELELDVTKETLYNDWEMNKNEYGLIREIRH